MFGRSKNEMEEMGCEIEGLLYQNLRREMSPSQHQALCQAEVNSVYAIDVWCLEAVKVDGRSLGVSQVLNF